MTGSLTDPPNVPRESPCQRIAKRAAIVLLSLAATGCDGMKSDSEHSPPAEVASFHDVFTVVDTIRLFENDTVLNVLPSVFIDGESYVIADGREHRVRAYGADGGLIWQIGREGEGPGEFRDPRVGLRLQDGRFAVLQFNERLTVFDSLPREVLATYRTPFQRVETAAVMSNGMVVVSALLGTDFEAPRLHAWRIGAERPDTSFFSPFAETSIRDAAIIGGFVQFAVRNDTIAAIWSLSDSVYLFSGDGRRLGSVPFRSRFFRTPDAEPPGPSAAPQEHVEWLASFNYASGVWWVTPQLLAVKYFDLLPREGMDRRWHLLLVPLDPDESAVEIRNVEVLAVNPLNGDFVFPDTTSLEPNRWIFARLTDGRGAGRP
jgi:hypothetical protein